MPDRGQSGTTDDRTIQTFMKVAQQEGQENLPHHYAILASPSDPAKKKTIDDRLAAAHISPIWFAKANFSLSRRCPQKEACCGGLV